MEIADGDGLQHATQRQRCRAAPAFALRNRMRQKLLLEASPKRPRQAIAVHSHPKFCHHQQEAPLQTATPESAEGPARASATVAAALRSARRCDRYAKLHVATLPTWRGVPCVRRPAKEKGRCGLAARHACAACQPGLGNLGGHSVTTSFAASACCFRSNPVGAACEEGHGTARHACGSGRAVRIRGAEASTRCAAPPTKTAA